MVFEIRWARRCILRAYEGNSPETKFGLLVGILRARGGSSRRRAKDKQNPEYSPRARR